jgi:hypothetical protein
MGLSSRMCTRHEPQGRYPYPTTRPVPLDRPSGVPPGCRESFLAEREIENKLGRGLLLPFAFGQTGHHNHRGCQCDTATVMLPLFAP